VPAAVAVAEAPSPGVPPARDDLVELWPAVLDSVRTTNGLLAAILAACQPVGVEGAVVTLAFPQSEAFGHRKADDASHRAVVAEALRAVTGHALRPAYELRDDLPLAEEPPPPTEEEWIARFKEAFDAEELTHEEENE
jgi:hypothetical protein